MRRLLMTALCLLALPALAANELQVRGHWQVQMPNNPSHTGLMQVDAEGRATYDATWQRTNRVGQPEGEIVKAQLRGYIEPRALPKVEFVVTDGSKVNRLYCTRRSDVVLHCHYILSSGEPSGVMVLTKIGPGPESLMPAPQ